MDNQETDTPKTPHETPDTSGVEEPRAQDLDFAQIETPEELRPPAAAPPVVPTSTVVAPALERTRPPRERVISRAVWVGAAVALGALVVVAVGLVVARNASVTVVPDVISAVEGEALARLDQAGLVGQVSERRFSSEPAGRVLAQDPAPGVEGRKGDVVELVVSAGTEEFAMPDVIGDGIALARGTLGQRGLVLTIESVPSEAASDTVIATTPAAGSIVRTGDVVRVQVAAPLEGGRTLHPYRMDGLTFVIDPAPGPAGRADVTLEASRRLQALLEASGARVVLLRTAATTRAETDRRASVAQDTTATAAVGLSVRDGGKAGRTVEGPGALAPSLVSSVFPKSVANQLATLVPPSVEASSTGDSVLGELEYPWARVRLGSFANEQDAAAFADPKWIDRVAEALYTAMGEVFGTKEQQ